MHRWRGKNLMDKTKKTHCSGCGCHEDNIRFIHCYGEKHRISITKEESLEMFPRDCYIDIRSKKLKCSKTREIINTQDELKTIIK